MASIIAAALLCSLGIGLEVWAGLVLGSRRALGLDEAPPDAALPRLVFAGPFGLVRHPQSLGLLLILAGTVLAFRRPGLVLLAVVVGGVVVAMAVRDDREMARRFGDAYARYQRAVPLLVPWLGGRRD